MNRAILFGLFCLLPFFMLGQSKYYTINESWKFFKGDFQGAEKVNFDDADWIKINVPHTWNDKDVVDEESGYYRGKGWYRRDIYIGQEAENKQVILYFEGANQVTKVWINGKFIGAHEGGYTRFSFNITEHINAGAKNIFAIQVDNSHSENIPPLSADFTFFGGIYRDIAIIYKNDTHISATDYASSGVYLSTPEVSDENASLILKTKINNHLDKSKRIKIQHTIISPSGHEIGQHWAKAKLNPEVQNVTDIQNMKIDHPALWDPDSPQLYKVITRIISENGNEVLDEVTNSLGFRWYEFHPENGFSINGKPLKLIGTNRHQCFAGLGNALRDEMHVRDIRLLKKMGGNFLRVSHYPQDPVVLEMCDRLGIITSVEIPSVNRITETEEFFNRSVEMVKEMVRQNFNHPSVLIWNYMNEIMLRPPHDKNSKEYDAYCTSVEEYGHLLEQTIRKEDLYRKSMLVFHGSLSAYEDANLVEVPQLVGWNLYSGWYGPNFSGFDNFLDDFHAKYPEIPVFVSEYGAGADPRLHSFEPQRFDFTVEYANMYHEHYLEAIMERSFVNGANIWNLNDFHSELRGDAVPHINSKGVTGIDRELKDPYQLYTARFSGRNTVLIGSKSWKYRGGVANEEGITLQPVKVFSNSDSIDFYHNNVCLGRKAVIDNTVVFEVSFVHGENTLEAIGTFGSQKMRDILNVQFSQVPYDLREVEGDFASVNVSLGSKRFFEDRDAGMVWIPEQPYTSGSWGYVGGEINAPKTWHGSLPAFASEIKNTDHDPIFQTQRKGLEQFKFDVPEGKYAVYLYWAELETGKEVEALAYNLGNDQIDAGAEVRVFDVFINDELVLDNLDLANQAGVETAVIKKFSVNVNSDKGIDVRFEAEKGSPVLNAVRIYKIF